MSNSYPNITQLKLENEQQIQGLFRTQIKLVNKIKLQKNLDPRINADHVIDHFKIKNVYDQTNIW